MSAREAPYGFQLQAALVPEPCLYAQRVPVLWCRREVSQTNEVIQCEIGSVGRVGAPTQWLVQYLDMHSRNTVQLTLLALLSCFKKS